MSKRPSKSANANKGAASKGAAPHCIFKRSQLENSATTAISMPTIISTAKTLTIVTLRPSAVEPASAAETSKRRGASRACIDLTVATLRATMRS